MLSPQEEAAIIAKYTPYALHFARRAMFRAPKHDRPGIIQSALIGLWKAARGYQADSRSNFANYAAIRIKGQIADDKREHLPLGRRAFEAGVETCPLVAAENAAGPDNEKLENSRYLDEIRGEITRLPEKQRIVLEGMLNDETGEALAARLGLSRASVSALKTQGLARLKFRLRR